MYTFSPDSVSNVYDNDMALVVVALSIAVLEDAVLEDVPELSL